MTTIKIIQINDATIKFQIVVNNAILDFELNHMGDIEGTIAKLHSSIIKKGNED